MRIEFVATPDPPPKGVPNPIHDADGASSAGYQGALVAGVRTYGWAVQAVVGSAGDAWLGHGWVDFSLRRPLFATEQVTIDADDGVFVAAVGDRVVLDGTFGTGRATWADELDPPPVEPGVEPPDVRPTYDLDTAPIGRPLRPLTVPVSATAAGRLATDDLGISEPRYLPGDGQLVHPYFVAGRMAPLTRHNFTYGPTIHVRSQIQHLGPLAAGQDVTVGARIVETYDRNDHWYQVLDGVVSDGVGRPVAHIRHHTIFRPRGTEMPEPTGSVAAG